MFQRQETDHGRGILLGATRKAGLFDGVCHFPVAADRECSVFH
jgi:hypothetical protein